MSRVLGRVGIFFFVLVLLSLCSPASSVPIPVPSRRVQLSARNIIARSPPQYLHLSSRSIPDATFSHSRLLRRQLNESIHPRSFFSNIKSAVGKATGAVKQAAGRVTSTVKKAAGRAVGAVKNVAKKAAGAVKNVAKKVTGAARKVANKVGNAVGKVTSRVKGAVKKVANKVGGAVRKVANKVGKAVGKVTSRVKGAVRKVANKVGGAVRKVTGAVRKVANKVGKAVGKVTSRVKGAVRKVANKVGGAVRKVTGAVRKVANKVGGAVRKVGQKIGGAVRKVANKVGGAVKNVANKVGGAVRKVANKVGGTVKSVANKVGGAVKRVGKGIKEGAQFLKQNAPAMAKIGLKVMSATTSLASHAAKFVPGAGTLVGVGLGALSTAEGMASDSIDAKLPANVEKGMQVLDVVSDPVGYAIEKSGIAGTGLDTAVNKGVEKAGTKMGEKVGAKMGIKMGEKAGEKVGGKLLSKAGTSLFTKALGVLLRRSPSTHDWEQPTRRDLLGPERVHPRHFPVSRRSDDEPLSWRSIDGDDADDTLERDFLDEAEPRQLEEEEYSELSLRDADPGWGADWPTESHRIG